mmetsp:Transcript_2386/g.5494  ORF Transcript_2386/g.5494 Transcript_2386/m.5494 type:complete len:327 (-) Transcript_2386:599-1579(-)
MSVAMALAMFWCSACRFCASAAAFSCCCLLAASCGADSFSDALRSASFCCSTALSSSLSSATRISSNLSRTFGPTERAPRGPHFDLADSVRLLAISLSRSKMCRILSCTASERNSTQWSSTPSSRLRLRIRSSLFVRIECVRKSESLWWSSSAPSPVSSTPVSARAASSPSISIPAPRIKSNSSSGLAAFCCPAGRPSDLSVGGLPRPLPGGRLSAVDADGLPAVGLATCACGGARATFFPARSDDRGDVAGLVLAFFCGAAASCACGLSPRFGTAPCGERLFTAAEVCGGGSVLPATCAAARVAVDGARLGVRTACGGCGVVWCG